MMSPIFSRVALPTHPLHVRQLDYLLAVIVITIPSKKAGHPFCCLLYTSDAADDSLRVDLGGRRIIKK